MKAVASRSVRNVVRQIEKKTGVDRKVVRKAVDEAVAKREAVRASIAEALKHGNLDGEFKFLTYAGLLPVELPDGTKIAVLPDIHVPAHDKKVMWAVLRALKEYQPDIVIIIGDVADCFAVGRWTPDPTVRRDFQNELDETRELLDEIREISGCYWMFVIMGNHEDRLFRLLMEVCPGLANVVNPHTRERAVTIHDLMGYGPEDNITFLYDTAERGGFGGGILVNGQQEYHHGWTAPRTDTDKTGRSTSQGHTHAKSLTVRETVDSEVSSSQGGHLVNVSHPYMAYAAMLNKWAQGLEFHTVVNGKVHIEPLPISEMDTGNGDLRKVLVWGDKVYLSSDR